MKGIRARIDYILKHNRVVSKAFRACASFGIRLLGVVTPVDDNAVLFSGHSRKYNDSPRAIYEYMRGRPEFAGYTFYWALDDPEKNDVPGRCIKVVPDTFAYFRTALKCKYWVTCVNIERSLHFKRKKTVYLNTWHGIPIKTIGNCAGERSDYDFSSVDFFCVSGDYEVPIYENSFCIKPESLIKTGMPRNDTLYHTTPEECAQIKRRLGLPGDKKVLLYVPTWRDSKDGGKSYEIRPPMDLDLWKRELGGQFVLLFRTHPYTNALLGVSFDGDFLRDFTDYPDINDLLKVTDVLISDYSATIFDFAILERPLISFAYDFVDYEKERGFALDLAQELPGGIQKTEEEVIDRILHMDYEKECSAVKEFKHKYLTYGGQATAECVRQVFGK